MDFESLILLVEKYSTHKFEDEFELTEFFDSIRDKVYEKSLSYNDKQNLILSLFKFIKNQPSDLEENFSFIHLIENVDDSIYDSLIVDFVKKNPSITSLLLLNRYINSLENYEREESSLAFQFIFKNKSNSKLIKDLAREYYNYQN